MAHGKAILKHYRKTPVNRGVKLVERDELVIIGYL